jgi:hypothetical protein
LSFDVFAGSEIKTFKPAQQDGCRLVKEEHGSFMTKRNLPGMVCFSDLKLAT